MSKLVQIPVQGRSRSHNESRDIRKKILDFNNAGLTKNVRQVPPEILLKLRAALDHQLKFRRGVFHQVVNLFRDPIIIGSVQGTGCASPIKVKTTAHDARKYLAGRFQDRRRVISDCKMDAFVPKGLCQIDRFQRRSEQSQVPFHHEQVIKAIPSVSDQFPHHVSQPHPQ